MFDPATADRLAGELALLTEPPRRVVLSPTSEPLPLSRPVRRETGKIIDLLLNRGIDVVLVTRGRIDRKMIARFAGPSIASASLCRSCRSIGRFIAHLSRSPRGPKSAFAGSRRLIDAGVSVEVRLEPIIAGLNDSRAALSPLFRALSSAGVRDVMAHHLFVVPAMLEPLRTTARPFRTLRALERRLPRRSGFFLGQHRCDQTSPTRSSSRKSRRTVSTIAAEHGILIQTGKSKSRLARSEPDPQPQPNRAKQEVLIAV